MARDGRRRRGDVPRRGEREPEGVRPSRAAWLWLVIVGAVLLSVPPLMQRAELERSNDSVELVADLDSIRLLSAYADVPVDAVLADWAARGVTSVGVSTAADLALAARAGLRPVPRTVVAVQAWLERGAAPAAGIFIVDGDVVPGYPDDLAATAALLRDAGLTLGIVEFAGPEGERRLARLLGDEVVFVHSIPPRELVHLTDEQALARFNRAVLERQARVLYVHALPPAPSAEKGRALLERNGRYVSALVEKIRALSLSIGPVRPLPRWESSHLVPVAVAVAAAAAAALAARALMPVSWTWELVFVVTAGAAAAALIWTGRDVLARQGAAFAAACAFPALAVLSGVDGQAGERGFVRRFGSVMLVTSAGAALVAAALTDTRFFLKLEQFRGVKAAHLLPILFVALVWLKRLLSTLAAVEPGGRGTSASGSAAGHGVPARLQAWATAAARLVRVVGRRQLAAFVVGAALVLFLLVARTGHDLLPVSSWELAAREALERLLVVRPRTKEVLFGYPALLLGLSFLARRRRRQGWPLAVAGVVAPVSVVNTFSHAHVALWVSGVRTAYGVIFGSAVASLAYVALALWRKGRPAAEEAVGGRSDERGGATSREAEPR